MQAETVLFLTLRPGPGIMLYKLGLKLTTIKKDIQDGILFASIKFISHYWIPKS